MKVWDAFLNSALTNPDFMKSLIYRYGSTNGTIGAPEFAGAVKCYRESLRLALEEVKQNVELPCENCGSHLEEEAVCSLDRCFFCCEECLDTYLNGGTGGLLSPNPQDTYNPEPYQTSFYVYQNGAYHVRDDI